MRSYALSASLILALTFPLKSAAATATDWAVFVEQDPKECWAVTAPKSGSYKEDGQESTCVLLGPIWLEKAVD